MIKKIGRHINKQDKSFIRLDFATFMGLLTIIVLGLFISLSIQAKVLDIIIGGDMGVGIQCKSDSVSALKESSFFCPAVFKKDKKSFEK